MVCSPPSGALLPRGTTTVTCAANDGAANTTTCNFTVTIFNACIHDDTTRANLLFNSQTGDYLYRRCGANGFSLSGKGSAIFRAAPSHWNTRRRTEGVLRRWITARRRAQPRYKYSIRLRPIQSPTGTLPTIRVCAHDIEQSHAIVRLLYRFDHWKTWGLLLEIFMGYTFIK